MLFAVVAGRARGAAEPGPQSRRAGGPGVVERPRRHRARRGRRDLDSVTRRSSSAGRAAALVSSRPGVRVPSPALTEPGRLARLRLLLVDVPADDARAVHRVVEPETCSPTTAAQTSTLSPPSMNSSGWRSGLPASASTRRCARLRRRPKSRTIWARRRWRQPAQEDFTIATFSADTARSYLRTVPRCVLALTVLLLLVADRRRAEARVVVERDTRGEMRAELSYDRTGDEFNRSYRDFTVRVYDGDELVFERELRPAGRRLLRPPASSGAVGLAPRPRRRPARGARRLLLRRRLLLLGHGRVPRDGDTYAQSSKNWGPKRPRLANLGGGRPEFISHDDRFLNPYGCDAVLALPAARVALRRRRVPRRHAAASRDRSSQARRNCGASTSAPARTPATSSRSWRPTWPPGISWDSPRAGWRLVRRALRRGSSTTGAGDTTSARAATAIRSGCGGSCARTGYR